MRGALAIVFGAVILIWPDIGLATLIALFGAFALVSGLTTIAGAFDLPGRGGERAWLVVEGLLGVAAGIAVLVWPDLSALALLYAIAAWAIAVGILQTTLAFVLRAGGRSLLLVLAGLVSIAFGVVMFGHPGAGAVALLALISAFALVSRRDAARYRARTAEHPRRARAPHRGPARRRGRRRTAENPKPVTRLSARHR